METAELGKKRSNRGRAAVPKRKSKSRSKSKSKSPKPRAKPKAKARSQARGRPRRHSIEASNDLENVESLSPRTLSENPVSELRKKRPSRKSSKKKPSRKGSRKGQRKYTSPEASPEVGSNLSSDRGVSVSPTRSLSAGRSPSPVAEMAKKGRKKRSTKRSKGSKKGSKKAAMPRKSRGKKRSKKSYDAALESNNSGGFGAGMTTEAFDTYDTRSTRGVLFATRRSNDMNNDMPRTSRKTRVFSRVTKTELQAASDAFDGLTKTEIMKHFSYSPHKFAYVHDNVTVPLSGGVTFF